MTMHVEITQDHETGDYDFHPHPGQHPAAIQVPTTQVERWTTARQAWDAAQAEMGELYHKHEAELEQRRSIERLKYEADEAIKNYEDAKRRAGIQ